MQPIDLPLTFGGHPDSAQPLEAVELFGIRVRGNLPTDTDQHESLPVDTGEAEGE